MTGQLQQVLEKAIVRFWAWREKPARRDGGPRPSSKATDNVMRTMSLVMPLRDKTAVGRAKLTEAVASSLDEIYSGLDNVGTVHFARFVIVENSLLMFSWYDGDFRTYIRDFIVTMGNAFDAVVGQIEDPPPTPCKEHVEAFIDWVHEHDLYQMPDNLAEIPDQKLDDARLLGREMTLLLHTNPNAVLGTYRAYPGFSVAQVREKLGIGW